MSQKHHPEQQADEIFLVKRSEIEMALEAAIHGNGGSPDVFQKMLDTGSV